ncbi:MAG TPA: MarR family transcriptional regulator, partial [Gammaproteobacteria bacterium]|nr:MarR family transcriptional regulator [Gammaproteobacteria bacterium]
VIFLRGPLTATEVASYTKLDKMTVSRAVKYLQNRKLIITENSPSDKRSRLLSVNKTGQQICQEVLPGLLSYQREVFSVLDDSEKQSFEAIYKKLMQKISELL